MFLSGAIQPARFLTDTGDILPGVSRVVKVPAPGAGNEWSITVPGGVQWKILSGRAQLVTSATVATRIPEIQLTSEGVDIGRYPCNVTVTAGVTSRVAFSQQLGTFTPVAGVVDGFIALPWFPLGPGDTISSLTTALQAGDVYDSINIRIAEYYFTNQQLSEIERYTEEARAEILAEAMARQPRP